MTLICGCRLTPATATTPEVFAPCHEHARPVFQSLVPDAVPTPKISPAQVGAARRRAKYRSRWA